MRSLDFKDRETAAKYLQKFPGRFNEIPAKYCDWDFCCFAVSLRGCNLEYVPEYLKDIEMCKVAVTDDIYAMHYVPDAFKKIMENYADKVNFWDRYADNREESLP